MQMPMYLGDKTLMVHNTEESEPLKGSRAHGKVLQGIYSGDEQVADAAREKGETYIFATI